MLATSNEVILFIESCINDSAVVFAVELVRLRDSWNQKADLEPGDEWKNSGDECLPQD